MKNKQRRDYCVYQHSDDNGIVFYVGAGNPKRPFDFGSKHRANVWKQHVLEHCVSGKPTVKILHNSLDLMSAHEQERFWISAYGRKDLGNGPLVNLTDGGVGTQGMIHTAEAKRKVSETSKGRIHTEETKRKVSEKLRDNAQQPGYVHPQKGKPGHNKGTAGSYHTAETKAKIGAILKEKLTGRKLSEEHKANLSKANTGRVFTEEHKANLSKANTRRKLTNFQIT